MLWVDGVDAMGGRCGGSAFSMVASQRMKVWRSLRKKHPSVMRLSHELQKILHRQLLKFGFG
jgi:hypothetical protein